VVNHPKKLIAGLVNDEDNDSNTEDAAKAAGKDSFFVHGKMDRSAENVESLNSFGKTAIIVSAHLMIDMFGVLLLIF